MSAKTFLGFDYGERRIGVAVGQTISGTAQALTVVNCKNQRPDWTSISTLIDQWQPDGFVVGLPAGTSAEPQHLGARIKRFARQLTGRFHRPVNFIDEHLSSIEAEWRTSHNNGKLDAHAAEVILETWFNVNAES